MFIFFPWAQTANRQKPTAKYLTALIFLLFELVLNLQKHFC